MSGSPPGGRSAAAARARGPRAVRGLAVIAALVAGTWWLAGRARTGEDDRVKALGRIEVTARLLARPQPFPQLGAYRYTYVLKYEVLRVHRSDPAGRYPIEPGDVIFVGHYKPWMPRSEIQDENWHDGPLGGRLDRFRAGEAHRMALDYELGDLAPAGVLDLCFPQGINRFFAIWTNPTSY